MNTLLHMYSDLRDVLQASYNGFSDTTVYSWQCHDYHQIIIMPTNKAVYEAKLSPADAFALVATITHKQWHTNAKREEWPSKEWKKENME